MVCGWNRLGISLAMGSIWCALSARITTSCAPASLSLLVALTLRATCSAPSSSISFRPFWRIASRCAPRAIGVASSPASASFAPIKPPMAPAPTTQIFMGESSRSFVFVGQCADAVNDDLDLAARFHRADADGRAAADDVARIKRHVPRNQAHDLRRLEDHVAHRVILPLLAIEQGLHVQVERVQAGGDDRAEHAEGVEALGARPLGEARILLEYFGGGDVVDA